MFKDREDKQWKFTYLIVDIVAPSPTRLMLESYVPAWDVWLAIHALYKRLTMNVFVALKNRVNVFEWLSLWFYLHVTNCKNPWIYVKGLNCFATIIWTSIFKCFVTFELSNAPSWSQDENIRYIWGNIIISVVAGKKTKKLGWFIYLAANVEKLEMQLWNKTYNNVESHLITNKGIC